MNPIQEIFTVVPVEPSGLLGYDVVVNGTLVCACTSEASAVSLAALLNAMVARHQGNTGKPVIEDRLPPARTGWDYAQEQKAKKAKRSKS